jgi:hypothetical protein
VTLNDPRTLGPLIGVGVALAFMTLRLFRASRAKPLRLEWLWVLPAVLLLATGALIRQMPPHHWEWAGLALALAIGAGIGWQRGRMMTITVDPETHALNQQASPLAILFLVGVVAVRYLLREGLNAEAAAWHLSAAFLTDVFVVFALGLLTATRAEMFIRARRMLEAARTS